MMSSLSVDVERLVAPKLVRMLWEGGELLIEVVSYKSC